MQSVVLREKFMLTPMVAQQTKGKNEKLNIVKVSQLLSVCVCIMSYTVLHYLKTTYFLSRHGPDPVFRSADDGHSLV